VAVAGSGVTVTERASIVVVALEPEAEVVADHAAARAVAGVDTTTRDDRLTSSTEGPTASVADDADVARGASANTAFDDAPVSAAGTITGSKATGAAGNGHRTIGIVHRGTTMLTTGAASAPASVRLQIMWRAAADAPRASIEHAVPMSRMTEAFANELTRSDVSEARRSPPRRS
jgi:hypothetical protein